jgi:hypothetical protein
LRQRFVKCGLACSHDQPRPGAEPKIDQRNP